MQENLDKMEKFFKYNLEIKRLLHSIVPVELNGYNKEYIMEYSDKLFQAINDIEYYINVTLENFEFSSNDKDYFKKFIKALKKELIKYGYKYSKLKKFYEVCFSRMSETLIDKVGREIAGGYVDFGVPLKEAKTINEILHIIHRTIVNNENNYRNLPVLASKQNHEGNNITLYGKDSELAKQIFKAIPYEISSDYVEIMSLSNDKIILMIRDIGHALSIEIEKGNDKYYVNYFIPKICNVEMVNNLRGVNKVTEKSRFTVGMFETSMEKLPFELVDFISKVPADIHINKQVGIQR